MTDAPTRQTPQQPETGAEPSAPPPTEPAAAPARSVAERAGGGVFSGLASLFGGGKEHGGDVKPGRFALTRQHYSKLALYVTYPVLCWVFYTTSSGMIDIMRREAGDWVGFIGTIIGTTAILTMLASTSWSLGADVGALIARQQFLGERIVIKTLITGCVYLFVFSISAFFSFTYYYNNIFGLSSKKIASQLQPMELAAEVLLPAGKSIAENYDAESARIVASPAMRLYLDRLDALMQTANSAAPQLRDSVRKAQEDVQRQAAVAARKTANDLAEAQAARRQLGEAQAKIAALDQTIAQLEPIIKAKEEQIATYATTERQEEQLALDAAKGLDNLGAACGPNCQSHRSKAEGARKRIAALRETLAGPAAERANALKQRDLLAGQLITLKQEEENALSRRPAQAPKADIPADLATTLRDLAQARVDIGVNPTAAKVRDAKGLCSVLLRAERNANVLPGIVGADFDCEPIGRDAHDLLAVRDEVIAARASFDQKCALDGALRQELQTISNRIRTTAETDVAAGGKGFNDAKQLIDACIVSGKSAGLSEVQVQALLKRSDQFLQSHSFERNRFELAREAFVKLTPDATMAICVAIAQDAFMFVMKLLSEILKRETKSRERSPLPASMDVTDNDEEDWDIRVLKTLLRQAQPSHGATSLFDAQSEAVAALPAPVRENLIGLLNRLVRGGIAYVDRKGNYLLDDKTLIEAEARLEVALKRRRVRSAASGSRDDLLKFGEGPGGWRRGRGALEQYLAPRFLTPTASYVEQIEDSAS
jgi:hypothetical protein